MGLKRIWKIAELIDYYYVRWKSAHFSFLLDPNMVHFYSSNQKSCFLGCKMAFSSKNGSSGWGWNLSQNTQKMTIVGFQNDTKPLLLTEIELRRCICVAHIPGYQNNTLETILGLLLALVGWFKKNHQNHPFIFCSRNKNRPCRGPTKSWIGLILNEHIRVSQFRSFSEFFETHIKS